MPYNISCCIPIIGHEIDHQVALAFFQKIGVCVRYIAPYARSTISIEVHSYQTIITTLSIDSISIKVLPSIINSSMRCKRIRHSKQRGLRSYGVTHVLRVWTATMQNVAEHSPTRIAVRSRRRRLIYVLYVIYFEICDICDTRYIINTISKVSTHATVEVHPVLFAF